MNGFDAIAEISRTGLTQIVRAYWASHDGTEAFKEVEKELYLEHRLWPPMSAPGEPVEAGVALVLKLAPKRAPFGPNTLGLASDQFVDVAVYASSPTTAVARLWTSLRLRCELQIRYPGPLTPFRKCGDFIEIDVAALIIADAEVSRGQVDNESDALIIAPGALRLERAIFFDDAQLPPEVRAVFNEIVAQLLPLVVGNKNVPLSSKLDRLFPQSEGIVRPPGYPLLAFKTLNASGVDVTGTLTGDDRFAPGVQSTIFAGAAFGYNDQPPRNPDPAALMARRPVLLGKQSHIALSLSSWVLEYFEMAHLENAVRSAFNDGMITQRGEQPQDPNQPLRYRPEDGWAMYQLPKGPFVLEEDDDVLVVLHSQGLRIVSGGKLVAQSRVRLVQQPLDIGFLDWADPDNDLLLKMELRIRAHDPPAEGQPAPDYHELVPEVADWQVVRLDNVAEIIWSAVISLLDWVKLAFNAITDAIGSLASWEWKFDRSARALISLAIDYVMFFTPVLGSVLAALFPDAFDSVIKPTKLPTLSLFGSKDYIKLAFKDQPVGDPARNNEPRDYGLTIPAIIEF